MATERSFLDFLRSGLGAGNGKLSVRHERGGRGGRILGGRFEQRLGDSRSGRIPPPPPIKHAGVRFRKFSYSLQVLRSLIYSGMSRRPHLSHVVKKELASQWPTRGIATWALRVRERPEACHSWSYTSCQTANMNCTPKKRQPQVDCRSNSSRGADRDNRNIVCRKPGSAPATCDGLCHRAHTF